jgi:hypothetical protein
MVALAAVALAAPVMIVGTAMGDDRGSDVEATVDTGAAPTPTTTPPPATADNGTAPPPTPPPATGAGGPAAGPAKRQQRRGQQAMIGLPAELRKQRARDDAEMPPDVAPRGPALAAAPPPMAGQRTAGTANNMRPEPPPVEPGASPPTDIPFNVCNKVPAGKRVIKMNLKPEVELPELVAWISSVTCKRFVIPGHISAGGKKLTVVAPALLTRDEAYAAFLNALDTIGLTVEGSTSFLRIIETSRAKSAAVPVYGFDGRPAQ